MTFRIIWSNSGDDASLSVSPAAAAAMPITRLQAADRKCWRSTSAADQVITGTWSTARMVNSCVLYRHNLTSAGYWRLELFSDTALSALVLDSGRVLANPPLGWGEFTWGIDPWGATIFTNWAYAFAQMWFDGVAAQSFRLTISDPTNPAGYVQAARLFMGPALSLSHTPSYGLSLGWRENTKQTRMDDGSLRSDAAEPWREIAMQVKFLPNVDRTALLEAARQRGMRKDVFVSVFQGTGGAVERDYAMVAKWPSMPSSVADFPSRYSQQMTFTEA